MRVLARLALGLIPVAGWAQPQATPPPPVTAPAEDPQLQSLIRETLAQNPAFAQSQALVKAEQERIPQAKALPDPTLSLGIQNDGFKRLEIGTMETSYYQVMLTQPLPWPGKRGLRGEIASLGAEGTRTQANRTRMSLVADVKRTYYGLLLVRGQMDLLGQQAAFWDRAAEITKARYEVGQGSQADLLRAHLEQNRLRKTRLALQAQDRVQVANLNRLRGAPPETPLPTTARLTDLDPQPSTAEHWIQLAEQGSPELQAARVNLHQAEKSLDLAKRDRYPDFAVSAGVMPRGSFDPMWQVNVSIGLPLWSRHKQQRAVSEQEWRWRAKGSENQNVRNLLVQRIQERTAQLDAALETLKLYRSGLLVQSEASFQANLAQYEAGRAPFLSVLESLNGWTRDRGEYLQALAQAQSVLIAHEEYALAPAPEPSAPDLGAGSMGMGGSPSGAAAPSATPAAPSEAASTPSGGGGSAMKSM